MPPTFRVQSNHNVKLNTYFSRSVNKLDSFPLKCSKKNIILSYLSLLYGSFAFLIALFSNFHPLCDVNFYRSSNIPPIFVFFFVVFSCSSKFLLYHLILIKKMLSCQTRVMFIYYVNKILSTLLNYFCYVMLI